jgi:integrase
MARHLLTDAKVRAATVLDKPSKDGKPVKMSKLSDGDGLFLLVTRVKTKPGRPRKNAPKFTKRWRFAYRFAGRQNMLSLGDFPTVALASARQKADAARKLLAAGTDPSEHRKVQKLASACTFDAVSDEWLAKQTKQSKTTKDKLTWLVGLVRPSLGRLPVADITVQLVLAALKKIEARGRHDTAGRCRATVGRVFRLAINTGRRTAPDPTSTLGGGDVLEAPAGENRAAITEPVAFGELLRKIGGYSGSVEVKLGLQLLSLTWLRPGELRHLKWSDIGENDGQPAIILQPEATKMRVEHRQPLNRQAVAVLDQMREISGGGEYVFPCGHPRRKSGRPDVRPLSEGAFKRALAILGYTSDVMMPHGFRSSGATISANAGLADPHVIDAALAHRRGVTSTATDYNRATYFSQRVLLMQAWADHCDALRAGRTHADAGSVVHLRA